MKIVEVGIKLKNDLEYYDKILRENGLVNDFYVQTHDIYYTNKSLDGLSEKEMKDACIRLRSCNNGDYDIQNKLSKCIIRNKVKINKLNKFEKKLEKLGYKKVFDTLKDDYHYYKNGMTSKVQLQQVEDIGLLVYFDNKEYYDLDQKEQRKKLIDELNSYGFTIKYSELDLDKLRTLYYKKEMFSKNQNS